MTQRAYIFLIITALIIFLYILRKAFKKEISELDAILWLVSSFLALVFVSVPGSIDFLLNLTGVKYAPTAFLGLIILFLIIQNIKLTTKLYSIQKKQIKLTQEVALIDFNVNKISKKEEDE